MLLAVDIGNTNISFGLFDIEDNKKLIFSSEFSSTVNRSIDEYAVLFTQLFTFNNADVSAVDCSAISSVVPHLTSAVCNAVKKLFGCEPFMIGPGIRTGFKIKINDPATLGTDIVSNVASAVEIVRPPFVVFDAGTANTLTFVNSDGAVEGTVISPGIRISLEALVDNAEQIEGASFYHGNMTYVGKNTLESISSGVILGTSLMIDGFIRNIREKYLDRENGEKLTLIATGDYCDTIVENSRNKFFVKKNLTLNGICNLFLSNNTKFS